jgi:hypothetical protein
MRKLSKIILSVFYSCLILFSQKTMSAQKEQINQHLIFQQTLIKGKSNLNKWESKVKLISAKLITHEDNNNNHDFRIPPTLIDTLSIKIKVKDILSGNKKMDRLTRKALKGKEHPYITFFYLTNTLEKNENQKITGFLTIAGVTKKITTPVVFYKKDQVITLKGLQKLNMNNFGIKPPKAFLGILKTRKMIEIDFTLKFKSNFWVSREP